MAFHSFTDDPPGWQTLGSQTLLSNPYLEVVAVRVATPERPAGVPWTVVHRKAAVVVVPLTSDGKYLLVQQERVAVRRSLWEFPAGQIDDDAEAGAISTTGLRELREECGYTLAPGGTITSLGHFFPSAGFTDEHSHLLLASPVVPHPDGPHHDPAEAITGCRTASKDELRSMIASGEICDANTLASFARLIALDLA